MASSQFVSAYSQMFADVFTQRYQGSRKLSNTVKEMHGLVGDAYKLKYMDRQAMSEFGAAGADIPATTVTVTAPSITFKAWKVKNVVSEPDQLNFNADALRGLAESHADSIGRREDQVIIDSMVAGATTTIASGGTNLTVEKLLEARKAFGQNEVDTDELYLVLNWANFESLLKETEYTSSIFNDAKPLVDPMGKNGPFSGFKIIPIGDRPLEGGLPVSANIRDCFAWAPKSVCVGYRKDPVTRMVPEQDEARVSILSWMDLGGVVGDARGVIKIQCDES